jgi:hypothetical protein
VSSPQRPDRFWSPTAIYDGYQGLFSWGFKRTERYSDFILVARLRINTTVPPLFTYAFMCVGTTYLYHNNFNPSFFIVPQFRGNRFLPSLFFPHVQHMGPCKVATGAYHCTKSCFLHSLPPPSLCQFHWILYI